MFCTECGTKNSPDSKYCKECGAKVNDGFRTMMLSLDDLRAVDNEHTQERLTKLLDMAFWHNEAGNADAAVLACEAALAIHGSSTTAHSLLGTLYEKRGDDAKAIQHLEAVVNINPDSAADALKLEQLRRGVHVKAVAPPPVSRWVPPALAGLSVAGVKSKLTDAAGAIPAGANKPANGRKASPFIAAALMAGVVLIGGLLVIHSTAPVADGSARARRVTYVPALAPAPTAVAPSAYGGATGGASASPVNVAPVTLAPGPASHGPVPSFAADPFADSGPRPAPVAAPIASAALPRLARVPGAPRVPRSLRRAAGGRSVAALPPLSLRAVPLPGDAGLAPAPVSLPAFATVSSVPQHTVVVSTLPGASGGAQASNYASVAPSNAGRIRITIHNAPSGDSIALSDRDLPAAARADTSPAADGSSYEQTAIALQQAGNYRAAAAAYRSAIRAFQGDIQSGRDTETAARALQACQTGIQISEQSR